MSGRCKMTWAWTYRYRDDSAKWSASEPFSRSIPKTIRWYNNYILLINKSDNFEQIKQYITTHERSWVSYKIWCLNCQFRKWCYLILIVIVKMISYLNGDVSWNIIRISIFYKYLSKNWSRHRLIAWYDLFDVHEHNTHRAVSNISLGGGVPEKQTKLIRVQGIACVTDCLGLCPRKYTENSRMNFILTDDANNVLAINGVISSTPWDRTHESWHCSPPLRQKLQEQI